MWAVESLCGVMRSKHGWDFVCVCAFRGVWLVSNSYVCRIWCILPAWWDVCGVGVTVQNTICSNTRSCSLMMGIMMPETCWDRSLIINIGLVASCWFISLHPTQIVLYQDSTDVCVSDWFLDAQWRLVKTVYVERPLVGCVVQNEHFSSVIIFVLWILVCLNWNSNACECLWLCFYPLTVNRIIFRALRYLLKDSLMMAPMMFRNML